MEGGVLVKGVVGLVHQLILGGVHAVLIQRIIPGDDEIRITVTGDGFLYNMVRIIVGTLIEVGLGTREAEGIPALFGAKREEAGYLVPAQGLCLMEVTY